MCLRATVLPSYREGIPKSLIEAAACGLAIVTTDEPGCREMVRFQTADGRPQIADPSNPISRITNPESLNIGINDILVLARNAEALADAMQWMAEHAEARIRMGKASRELAEQEFGIEKVVAQTMSVYHEIGGSERS